MNQFLFKWNEKDWDLKLEKLFQWINENKFKFNLIVINQVEQV